MGESKECFFFRIEDTVSDVEKNLLCKTLGDGTLQSVSLFPDKIYISVSRDVFDRYEVKNGYVKVKITYNDASKREDFISCRKFILKIDEIIC